MASLNFSRKHSVFLCVLGLVFVCFLALCLYRATDDVPVPSDETTTEYYTYRVFNSPQVEGDGLEDKSWIGDTGIDKDLKKDELLSGRSGGNRFETIGLSFDFPFYGHLIRQVTIATYGYLVTGDLDDFRFKKASQCIALLQGDVKYGWNFQIKYADNGTAFTVLWENVLLPRWNSPSEKFTFEATLVNNGDIIFIYKKGKIDPDDSVFVGLSDAYILEELLDNSLRERTAQEYNRIQINSSKSISDGTVIIFHPLPTCLNFKTIEKCLDPKNYHLKCKWCEGTARCSTGIDRYRHQWLENKCEETAFSE